MKPRLFFTLLIVVLIIGLLPSADAQDAPPTDEEQALLDRFFTAFQQIFDYESFVSNSKASAHSEQRIAQDGVDQQSEVSDQETTAELTVIRGDNPNGTYNGTTTISITANEATTEYTVDGEFIYADGNLYGRGLITEGEADQAFPADFIEIPDPTFNEFSETFETSRFVTQLLGQEDQDFLIGSPEFLRETYTSITSSEAELDDQAVESILLRFEGNDLKDLLAAESGENTFGILVDFIDDSSYYQTEVLLDDADNLIAVRAEFNFVITEFVLNDLDPTQPPGLTLSILINLVEEQQYSQINEELESIAAPE